MPNGIIDTNMKKDDPLANVKGYKPEEIEMGPGESVEERVAGITSEDSPLMQATRTRAKQGAAQRGIVNTTMAGTAGEKAAIETATPIAAQDAQTSFQTKRANQQSTNQARQFTAGAQTEIAGQQLQGEQNLEQIEAQGEERRETVRTEGEIEQQLQEAQQNFQFVMNNAQHDQQVELQRIQNQNQRLLQSSQSASVLFSEISKSMAEVMASPELTVSEKRNLVNKQKQILSGGLEIIGASSDVDFTGLLDGIPGMDSVRGAGAGEDGTRGPQTGIDEETGNSAFRATISDMQELYGPDMGQNPEAVGSILQAASNLDVPAQEVQESVPGLDENTFYRALNERGYQVTENGQIAPAPEETNDFLTGEGNPDISDDQIASTFDQIRQGSTSRGELVNRTLDLMRQNNVSIDQLANAIGASREQVVENLNAMGVQV